MANDVTARLSWEQALAWRMERHRLVERAAPSDLVSVVSEICGLHAQLMSSAELSLWARIDGQEREALHDTLWNQRALVKLWAMRGTLHLLPSVELGVWLSALGAYTNRGNTGHPELDLLTEAVGRALDGRLLTREELARAVEQITGEPSFGELVRSSWGWPLKPASFRGRLCFAPSMGSSVRFTTPATWVPGGFDMPDPMDALREVTRRFLSAYAPVTDNLAGWWVGGKRAHARMLGALGEAAVEVDVEGQRARVLTRDVDAMVSARPSNVARLLPAFDPWVMGASGQPAVLEPGHRAAVYRPQGWISPVLLVNGRIAGVWKHARKGRRLFVEIEPFGRLPAWARAQIEAEAERLATFLDCELSAKWEVPSSPQAGF